MKKIIPLILTLVLVISACGANVESSTLKIVENIDKTVTEKSQDYVYTQKGVDYEYVETYNMKKDNYNVVYEKSGDSGRYKLDYTTTKNNKIKINSQTLDNKEIKVSDDLEKGIKNYDELYELHTEFLNTYVENLQPENNFKNIVKENDQTIITGKTEGDANIKIIVSDDENYFEVYEDKNEYRQSIELL